MSATRPDRRPAAGRRWRLRRRRRLAWLLASAILAVCLMTVGLYVSGAITVASHHGHPRGQGAAASPRHGRPVRPVRPGTPPPEPLGVPGDWRLRLDSRFTAGRYDRALWRPGWFGTGVTGPVNARENACYSSGNVAPGPAGLRLSVSATRSACAGRREPFTGAVISTNPNDGRASRDGFSYRYGVLEARVYVPGSGQLLYGWPAISTYGQHWPEDGEDDILEVQSGTACFHFHSVGYAPGGGLGGCYPGLTAGWHTVAADWEPGSVSYYLDGALVGSIGTGITSQPMYIAVDNTTNPSDGALARPDTVLVAYVRVWQHP